MRFGYAIAYVRDVGKTVEFWERAFDLKRRFVGENNEYAEMETGQTTLAAGAEVRFRKVRELAPEEAISSNSAWREHALETQEVQEASLDDLDWADAYVFGTPTRYGNVSSQLKQFIDTTAGLWEQGKLADKVAGGFTSTNELHGGQESTLLSMYNVFYHWGAIVVPMGYTDETIFAAGGNPYGVSSTDGGGAGPGEKTLAAARYQGRRIAEKAARLVPSRV